MNLKMNQEHLLLEKYGSEILKAIEGIECHGSLRFYHRNLFTYLKTSDKFNRKAMDVLSPDGFEVDHHWHKYGSPKSHISLMTNEEQDWRATFRDCSTVVNYYRGDEIPFSVDSVRMCRSYDKVRGRSKICCLLVVSSQSIGDIREDLGFLAESSDYLPHIYLGHKIL